MDYEPDDIAGPRPDKPWRRTDFWAIWSENYPVSFETLEAYPEAGLPERVKISRAGHAVEVTPDELKLFLMDRTPQDRSEEREPCGDKKPHSAHRMHSSLHPLCPGVSS